MNQDQIAALKAAAERFEMKVWIACGPAMEGRKPLYFDEVVVDAPDCEEDGFHICQIAEVYRGDEGTSEVMDFISLANPQTILTLLAERDALIARAEAAKRIVSGIRNATIEAVAQRIEQDGSALLWDKDCAKHWPKTKATNDTYARVVRAMQQEGGK